MPLARSRITAQGQISVPKEVRQRLGVGPGSVVEWEEEETGRISIRRAGKHSLEDVRRVLFPEGPPKRVSLKKLKQGIEDYIRDKHAGR